MSSDPFGLIGALLEEQYRIEQPAGEGGFSVVYRGTQVGSGEAIAVKCLKLSTLGDAEPIESFTRRFRDEARLLVRLAGGSPDLVRCLSSGTTSSPVTGEVVPYMVLEWLEGESLATDFANRRTARLHGRPLEEVMALFASAARALDHAHRQGVVHRDVKPGNLFLVAPGAEGARMKVLDFGLAKILDGTVGITLASTVGDLLLCSPRYAAPEQFDPKLGPVGPWTDVYSLAMVMLEALRDRRVRLGDGLIANMNEALDRNAALSPRALGIAVPPRVDAAFARALSFPSRARPKTAGELWDELTAALRDGSIAPPSPPPYGASTVYAQAEVLVEPPPEGVVGGGTVLMAGAPRRPPSDPAFAPTQIVAHPWPSSAPPPPLPASAPPPALAPSQRPRAPSLPAAPAPARTRALLISVSLFAAAMLAVSAFFAWRIWR